MTIQTSFSLNGRPVNVQVAGDELLSDCLRTRLQHTGTRVGCGEGVCGSCNVLVDGGLVRSCLMLAAQVDGAAVLTVEGLAGHDGPHPLQRAFVDAGAVQCGFCTPGLLMTVAALSAEADVTGADVLDALAGNLCRCTGYTKVVEAVRSALAQE